MPELITDLCVRGTSLRQQPDLGSDKSVGKGDWYPLQDPTKRATMSRRNCAAETPILLDPTDPDDANAIIFNDDGSPAATPQSDDVSKERINFAIRCLGLDQSQLNNIRRSIWRECYGRSLNMSGSPGSRKVIAVRKRLKLHGNSPLN